MSLGPSILLLGASSQFTHLHSTYWKSVCFLYLCLCICVCALVFVLLYLCLHISTCMILLLAISQLCPLLLSNANMFPQKKMIWFDFSSSVEIIVGVFVNIVWWMSLALRWCWVEWETMRNAQEHFYMFAFFVFLTNIIFPFSISFLSILSMSSKYVWTFVKIAQECQCLQLTSMLPPSTLFMFINNVSSVNIVYVYRRRN